MKVGFIGLGNVGGKLAGSLQPNCFELWVRDLDPDAVRPFLERRAHWAESPAEMAAEVDLIVTCLPSLAASAAVMEAADGLLAGIGSGKIWAEMSTTDSEGRSAAWVPSSRPRAQNRWTVPSPGDATGPRPATFRASWGRIAPPSSARSRR